MPRSLPQTDWLQPLFDASGGFETCRVKRGTVLHLEDHLERLEATLQALGMPRGSRDRWRRSLTRAARGIRDGFIRIGVNRVGEPPIIVYRKLAVPYSAKQGAKGVKVVTAPTRWPSGEPTAAQAKHSERLSSVLARLEGRDAVEVLRLGPHGYLTEGTVSNLFLVKNGVLITPPTWAGVLEGVTRQRVIQAALRLKIPVQEVMVTRHELFNADEAFLTNVLMGALPIREADGRRIGTTVPGSITRRIVRRISS